MTLLIVGLVMFLGIHSTRIFAESVRTREIARIGVGPWKAIYTVLSLIGFGMLVIGFRAARAESAVLYVTPGWMKHVTAVLMMLAMTLFVAAYIPKNWFKAKWHHPQLLSVKTWAVAHLLSVGVLADVVLFGAFLAWAVADFIVARKRDRANATVYPPANAIMTTITIAVGLVAWAVFAMWLHGPLIGVRPFGY